MATKKQPGVTVSYRGTMIPLKPGQTREQACAEYDAKQTENLKQEEQENVITDKS